MKRRIWLLACLLLTVVAPAWGYIEYKDATNNASPSAVMHYLVGLVATPVASTTPLPVAIISGSGGTPTGTAGTPNAAVVSVQGIAGGTAQPVSGTVAIGSPAGTAPVSVAGVDGSGNKQHLLLDTAGKAQVTTNPGGRTIVTFAAKTVTTGGTAVTAVTAGNRTAGGFIQNPGSPNAVKLCINEIGTASGTTTNGDTICIDPGTPYTLTASGNAVSVIASDSAHAFGGYGFQ